MHRFSLSAILPSAFYLLVFAFVLSGCYYPAYAPPTETRTRSEPASTLTATLATEVTLAGGEGTEVMVEGAAADEGDLGIARDRAIRDALRKAVEQGVGTYLNSDTRVQNFQLLSDRIYTQASGYVSSYRVVGEWQEAGLYRVAVRAKVKLDRIEDDLAAIGILVEEQGRPRIMVLVKELDNLTDIIVDDKMMSQELLETMLLGSFQAKGFPVVDAAAVEANLRRDQLKAILAGDDKAAQQLALRTGAEIVVAGTAQRSSETKTMPYTGSATMFYKLRLSVRAVNVATAAVIGASAFSREVPFSEDEARRQAADSAANELVSEILAGWKRRANTLEIRAENADFAKVQKFRSELLARIRGVTSVVQRELLGTSALLEVVSEASAQEMVGDLGSKTFSVPFTVTGFAGNRIEIKFTDAGGDK